HDGVNHPPSTSQLQEMRRASTVIGTRGKQATPTPVGSAASERKSVGTGGQSKVADSIHGSPSRPALAIQPPGRLREARGATSYQGEAEGLPGASTTERGRPRGA